MSEQNPEQMLMDEYNRIMRANPAGRSDLATSLTTAAIPLPRATAAPVSSTSARTSLSSRQVNQGYTLPVPEATVPPPSSGSSTLGTIGSTALKVFTGGLGLVPLITGLSGLFGGGSSTAPSPLVPYAMPRSVSVEAANAPGSSFQNSDYSQSGAARSYASPAAASAESSGQTPQSPTTSQSSSSSNTPQVVVNVSAMDSQSFLDRSGDIAQAVRQAMLSMNSLNDVVSEL